ncbi:16S rRNA (cytosine(967)-C(5))-methyltransferase [Tumidithrix elongata RA019]|uniref:16S rRNA (cytosine(967)-C(5))-methyltransferase n=1 Tax=Tumidithrix elongata BACA0141 TaxID=2716417 RepID=A0AAW9PXV8_9CYAN|nr:16S rRNA (cytosine(967)-C(5))-methyltransferase [Tumidithrix elongata RA019]
MATGAANIQSLNARQLTLTALRLIQRRGVYADVALNQVLQPSTDKETHQVSASDRRLTTELVYGITRRQRTLDSIILQFTRKPNAKLNPDLRSILQIGIYQICFLAQVPASAAVNTSVDLAKHNKLAGLAGFVNGVLRAVAIAQAEQSLWQNLPDLGSKYSFPDWLISLWLEEFGAIETEQLCDWFNQSPHIDLRVNCLVANTDMVLTAFADAGIAATALVNIPNAVRLEQGSGEISQLPGFKEGWWTVQDASAQLAALLLDPQPDDVVIDACAAPGGKTTHLAELMGDRGKIYALDRSANRLKRLKENCDRLQLKSIETLVGDSREFPQFCDRADRVLLDVPCSGLGTLHRHADARWRQTAEEPYKLAQLQIEILEQTAQWVKWGGVLVYCTCTLHPAENEAVIGQFLSTHPDWQLATPQPPSPLTNFLTPENWIRVLPHQQNMDGFFMAKLQHL